MAAGWEMGFGMGFDAYSVAPAPAAYMYGLPSTDTLRIDDLLDLSSQDHLPSSSSAATDTHLPAAPSSDPSSAMNPTVTTRNFDHHNYQHQFGAASLPDDLCYVPCEEAAELEWLSQFVEDSFSDMPYYPTPATAGAGGGVHFIAPSGKPDPSSATGRGHRTKSYQPQAIHHHTLHATSNPWSFPAPPHSSSSSANSPSSSSSTSDFSASPKPKSSGGGCRKKSARGEEAGGGAEGGGARRCTHCHSERTPQWRTGPMGPKTLCNACGVRYKSGRLVPEYRPAASPTFVLTQHSNSHRKVMELRRQKELVLLTHDGHPSAAAGGHDLLFHDYEVC